MAASLKDNDREHLDKPNFCHVATLREDGSVHAALVWVDHEGDRIVINSAAGRAWPANLERDPRVTLTIPDHENPYAYLSIRGRLVDTTEEGADAHADAMAKKYMGVDEYPFRQPGEQRIILKFDVEKIYRSGY